MRLIPRQLLLLMPFAVVFFTAFAAVEHNQQRWLQSLSPAAGVAIQAQGTFGALMSLMIPFHDPAGNALKEEHLFVFATEKRVLKQKGCQCFYLRDSLHGRLIFPISAGVALMLRNTSFRFLQHSWLMHLFLRC